MRRFVVLGVLLGLLALPGTAAANGPRFLGEAHRAHGDAVPRDHVGGLSSITYDERRGVYYALSDDQADVRFYTVGIDVRHGPADRGPVPGRDGVAVRDVGASTRKGWC